MANRKESCYEKKPLTCMYYAGNGKPMTKRVQLKSGETLTRREYKDLRKQAKALRRKSRKCA